MRLRLAPFLAIATAACTTPSNPPDRVSSSRARLTTARVAGVTPKDVLPVGVRVGAFTQVTVHVLPSATCVLRSEASAPNDSEHGLELFSSATGIVHFHARGDVEGASTTVRLDCTDEGGAHAAYAVELRGDPKAERESEPPDPSTYELRPALTGDLAAFSNEQIGAGHYPPRPDRVSQPDAYEHWVSLVSRPMRRITSEPVTVHGHRNGTAGPFLDSENWSGAVIDATNVGAPPSCPQIPPQQGAPSCLPMTLVAAKWQVPSVVADPNGGDPLGEEGQSISMWVGLDGWLTRELLQAGVVLDVVVSGSPPNFMLTHHYPFVEYYPADPKELGFDIEPGDEVFAQVWPCVAGTSLINIQGTYVCYEVDNMTTGQLAEGQTASAGPVFTGSSAEWILEHHSQGPCIPCSQSLLNFGSMEFQNIIAYEYAGGTPAGKPPVNAPAPLSSAQLIRLRDSNGTIQAVPILTPSAGTLSVEWNAFR